MFQTLSLFKWRQSPRGDLQKRCFFSQNTFGDCFFLNADAPMDSQSRFKEGREREKKETSGAYIGPCQRYVMEFFSEYSQRFFAGHIQKKFSLRYLTGS